MIQSAPNFSDYKFNTTAVGQQFPEGGSLSSGLAQKKAFVQDFNPRTARNYSNKWVFAPYDLVETAAEFHFVVDMAGCIDHKVYLQNDTLHVEGFKTSQMGVDDTLLFSQRSLGKVHRRMRLPPNVMWEGVKHALRDGVLTVKFPKKVPSTTFQRKLHISTDDI